MLLFSNLQGLLKLRSFLVLFIVSTVSINVDKMLNPFFYTPVTHLYMGALNQTLKQIRLHSCKLSYHIPAFLIWKHLSKYPWYGVSWPERALTFMQYHGQRETWWTFNNAFNLSAVVVKKSVVLPLQGQNAAQVSVQNDAGYKRWGLVCICVGKEREVHTLRQECLDECSERLNGSVSVSTVACHRGECRSAMLPSLLQPPRALYTGTGLHD